MIHTLFRNEMPIPQQQLETWTHAGASVSAQAAYASVRNAINAEGSPIQGRSYEVYLQGSYRNDTNVRADSDVDVVVELRDAFGFDISALTPAQVQTFATSYSNATYRWIDFRNDVGRTLRTYYGADAIKEGERCFKVTPAPGRVTADVLPSIQFRKYRHFYSAQFESFVDGIRFYDQAGRAIENYPKPHYENGVAKNSIDRTHGNFKRTVRMFKNARSRAADKGYLVEGTAPSYFVDCLIYNVPDYCFVDELAEAYCNVVNYLSKAALSGFLCRNEIVPLFGPSPEQWSENAARQLIGSLIRLWNEW